MEPLKVGCARPTGGIVGESTPTDVPAETVESEGGARTMAQVGKKAPDFTAPAYLRGEFVTVRLSEFLGRWVVLCFYPGDFTFV